MTLIVGEEVRVAAARDAGLLGLKGEVVLETMKTLTIKTGANRKVILTKAGSALELPGGAILLGDDLRGRLEDRLAAGRNPGRPRRQKR